MKNTRLEQLLSFLEEEPSDSFTRFALALEYLKYEDYQAAGEHFEYILQNEPGYLGVYYHLGKLMEHTGKPEQAETLYIKGIEQANQVSDTHAAKELREALEALA